VKGKEARVGGVHSSNHSREIKGFNTFIDVNLLFDIPLVGKKFTWFNANGSAKSRLDRVLVSGEWMDNWPMCKQYVQNREVSDHSAIVVKSLDKDWGPKPFRTIDAWFMERGFCEMVKKKWNSYPVQGSAFVKFKEKLKCLKGDLKVWNKDVFGDINTSKKRTLQEIEDFDCQDCSRILTEADRLKRSVLVTRLRELDKKLDSLIRQKAKGVEVGGQWCEEPCTVRLEAKKTRFKATKDLGVRLDGVEFKSLSTEVSLSLIAEFTKKEIRDSVWQCEGTKSPGSDGFNFNFLKKSWEVMKDEVVAVMILFHETGCIPKGCNASFVALVPKVRDPAKLEQYRPISLVGAMYKIIAKVLAERIKNVLPHVIDESQSTFLKGRGILDNILMANEVVEDLRRGGRSGLCLKMDFEKAYDSVRWDFLYYMQQRMGFHNRWILWIRGCMESASVSVLVNGSPTEEFIPSRGLRQGDPLTPFLFLVVAEGLTGLVREAVKANLLTGLKVGRKETLMSLLQFADDTLFFCEDSFTNVVTLKAILRGFELASGLKSTSQVLMSLIKTLTATPRL